MQQTSTLDEDEALARMLQYEEQTGGSGPAAVARRNSAHALYDDQEQRDSELARQFAQMEMDNDIPTRTNPRVVGYGATTRPRAMREGMRSHSLDREDIARRHVAAAAGRNSTSMEAMPSEPVMRSSHRHSRSFNEYDLQVDTSDNDDNLDGSWAALGDLEYARRLQEAAFARLRPNEPGVSRVTHTEDERRDMELARRMQELENNGLGQFNSSSNMTRPTSRMPASMQAFAAAPRASMDEDERIARLMAATGKSLRDLQPESPMGRSPAGRARVVIPEAPPSLLTPVGDARDSPSNNPFPTHSLPSTPLNHPQSSGIPVATAVGRPLPDSAPTSPVQSGEDTLMPGGEEAFLDVPVPVEQKKKKSRNFLGFRNRTERQKTPPVGSAINQRQKTPPVGSVPPQRQKTPPVSTAPVASGVLKSPPSYAVPAGIPPAPGAGGMVPLSMDTITGIPTAIPPPPGGSLSTAGRIPIQRVHASQNNTSSSVCFTCGQSTGSFIAALDKKYHPECFRCVVCHGLIDVTKPFAFSKDAQGYKHPHHPRCFSQRYAATCCVCRQKLPANEDGTISFVKHPFFDTEEMCPRHALEAKRRCTGCHRFEPDHERFIDLDDGDRCICFSCCRSVVVDSNDAAPLWVQVISFFRDKLGLPIWDGMTEIPIMVVGFEALNDQLQRGQNNHGGSSQIMTRGLCLTDHANCGRFRVPSMRFNTTDSSFEASNGSDRFTYYEVPTSLRANTNSNVFAIMCLSGLPRDLTASVLAHEATHAWIKMHPDFDVTKPIPPQVEEGVAQLMALLFLNDGLDDPQGSVPGETGPSDAKLRQYFRFSIETEENEVYGTGYRRAAAAYQALGIEALMMHVVRYRDFPHT